MLARAAAMQVARRDFLAATGCTFDQHRVGRVGDLSNLHPQQFDFLAGANETLDIAMPTDATAAGDDLFFQPHLYFGDITGLGYEIDRAIFLRLEYVFLVVLA